MAAGKKKVIQVPMEGQLLQVLARLSQDQGVSRSEMIREACRRYVRELEQGRREKAYRDGYHRLPEDSAIGEGQLAAAAHVLAEESW